MILIILVSKRDANVFLVKISLKIQILTKNVEPARDGLRSGILSDFKPSGLQHHKLGKRVGDGCG